MYTAGDADKRRSDKRIACTCAVHKTGQQGPQLPALLHMELHCIAPHRHRTGATHTGILLQCYGVAAWPE